MIDILSFNKSLRATWIKKYLDTENGGSWKLFFDAELQRYGGKLAILGNLNSKGHAQCHKGIRSFCQRKS